MNKENKSTKINKKIFIIFSIVISIIILAIYFNMQEIMDTNVNLRNWRTKKIHNFNKQTFQVKDKTDNTTEIESFSSDFR